MTHLPASIFVSSAPTVSFPKTFAMARDVLTRGTTALEMLELLGRNVPKTIKTAVTKSMLKATTGAQNINQKRVATEKRTRCC
jgi:hypothetical protein